MKQLEVYAMGRRCGKTNMVDHAMEKMIRDTMKKTFNDAFIGIDLATGKDTTVACRTYIDHDGKVQIQLIPASMFWKKEITGFNPLDIKAKKKTRNWKEIMLTIKAETA